MADSLCRWIRGRINIHSLLTAWLSQRESTGILEKMVDSEVAWSAVSARALLLKFNDERGRSRLLSVRGAKYVYRAREVSPSDRLLAGFDVMLSAIIDSIYNRQIPGGSLDG